MTTTAQPVHRPDPLKIPRHNVLIPEDEFIAVFDEAARRSQADKMDGYLLGVVVACRWVAGITRTAPVSKRPMACTPEDIEAERLLAEVAAYAEDGRVIRRPGFTIEVFDFIRPGFKGKLATLRWVQRGGVAPIE